MVGGPVEPLSRVPKTRISRATLKTWLARPLEPVSLRAPAPSRDACPARLRWTGTRPAGTWPSLGRQLCHAEAGLSVKAHQLKLRQTGLTVRSGKGLARGRHWFESAHASADTLVYSIQSLQRDLGQCELTVPPCLTTRPTHHCCE